MSTTTTKKDELMDLRIAVASMKEDIKALVATVGVLKQTLEQNNIHYEAPVAYTDIYR